MKKLIFLKLGGSLITDKEKPFTAKLDIIQNLAQQISEALNKDKNIQLVIGNGGGSYPHYPAVKYEMKEGIKKEEQKIGFCLVQDAASQLNRIIIKELLKAKVKACSINPSSIIIARDGKIKSFFIEPIIQLLFLGITPVLYGDIVYDEALGAKIFSTEQILSNLAIEFKNRKIKVEKIIHNGLTTGVLKEQGKIIPLINSENFNQVKKYIYQTKGFDVTGGMIHKINESLELAKMGVSSLIINGSSSPNILKEAILGKQITGTIIS